MATQKPISTISYNSEPFLLERLNAWLDAHIIQAYQYIVHKGEDGDKDHIHLRIEPNKKLDPMDLKEQLKEYVRDSDKPLGVRPWRPSKEEDWILYAVHEKHYLKLKYGGGEKGEKLPYTWEDIKCPDDYDMEIAYIRAMAAMQHTSGNMVTRLQQGTRPMDLILEGENVYTVNAILRALSDNLYLQTQEELTEARRYNYQLTQAVEELGYAVVVGEDGTLKLERVRPHE